MKVTRIKVTMNKAAIQAIKNRTKSELQSWSKSVLQLKVKPKTPVDTGRLRRETDISVVRGDKVSVWWFWKAPYAAVVEDAWGGRASPRAPGTIAPFAVPTITNAVKEEVAGPIGKAFGGR